jgi:hypothetical protein
MADQTLTFRCPRELEGLLPAPTPAGRALPDWLKAMPMQAHSAVVAGQDDTVKRCPPFVDAMISGFLIPLICDVRVENGELGQRVQHARGQAFGLVEPACPQGERRLL